MTEHYLPPSLIEGLFKGLPPHLASPPFHGGRETLYQHNSFSSPSPSQGERLGLSSRKRV